ncbi:MAG: pyridoxal phosphate-dependent aminotransferase [Gammaproteobacteria bacterium]
MTVASFASLYTTRFREKWMPYQPTSLHASNPHPFTVRELDLLIGENVLSIGSETLLDYGVDSGYPPLRQALVEQLYPQLQADNVLTCAGAQEGIYLCMHALLEKSDKVIAFTPLFEPLIATARDISCQIELLALDSENGWKIDFQQLAETIDDQTKMLIINYPHNPTGSHLTEEELGAIIALCQQHDVWLFSDEVFRGLEHDKADRLTTVAESYEKGISLGAISKAFGVPAIRVGWLVSQRHSFLDRCKTIKGYLSICNDQLGERLAVNLVKQAEILFDHHRQRLVANLQLLENYKPELDFHSPKAGCTVFANVAMDSERFAENLVKKTGLLVIPNKAFCTRHNAVRLGFGRKYLKKYLDQLF